MLSEICGGTIQVPPDQSSNGLEDCKPFFNHFYCDVIDAEFDGGKKPKGLEPCPGMKSFCGYY
jgi:hypothetical protein